MAFGGEEEPPVASDDTARHTAESSVVLPPRPQTALDLAAAKLAGTVRSRPGHVVVVGESAEDAHALFQGIEAQLERFLCIGVDGHAIDPEAVVRALWEADGRTSTSGGRPLAMMRVLAGEAALAGRPIVVTVTNADAAGAQQLERLRQMIESVPAAEEVVRIVLLGSQSLLDVLARPEARAVAMRVVASVRVPSAEVPATAPIPPPEPHPPSRSRASMMVGALVAGVLALAWLRAGSGPEPSPPPLAAAPLAVAPDPDPDSDSDPATPSPVVVPEPAMVAPADDPMPPQVPADPVPPPAPAEPPVARPTARVRTAAPMPIGASRLALQVGAFTSAANAEELRRRLGDRYGAASVSSTERDGQRYYRVRVSGFAGEAERSAAASALRAAGFAPVPVRD